jgi:hypothetical protein
MYITPPLPLFIKRGLSGVKEKNSITGMNSNLVKIQRGKK